MTLLEALEKFGTEEPQRSGSYNSVGLMECVVRFATDRI